jgi:hypothetical protein
MIEAHTLTCEPRPKFGRLNRLRTLRRTLSVSPADAYEEMPEAVAAIIRLAREHRAWRDRGCIVARTIGSVDA